MTESFQPMKVFEEGHGPLSTDDEVTGAAVGLTGAAVTYAKTKNPLAALLVGATGYIAAEETAD